MCATASAQNWKLLDSWKDKNTHLLVDQDRIERVSENTLRAWVKYKYERPFSEERTYDCRKCGLKKDLSYAIIYEEINCEERKFKLLRLIEYYMDKPPYAEEMDEDWKSVKQGSSDEVLINYLCK